MKRCLWLLLFLAGCARPAPSPLPEYPASPHPESDQTQTELRYIEHLTGGAQPDEVLPLIVAVHGLGDRPEHFVEIFEGWEFKARVVLPAGPTPWGKGHAWMTVRTADEKRLHLLGQQTLESADRIAAFLQEVVTTRPTIGKPVVTGFSQGGMISYALATRHGEQIRAASPVSGFLPSPLYRETTTKMAPVRALHGEADPILSIQSARDTVQYLKDNGGDATLRTYPGVKHSISVPMRADWFRLLEENTASEESQ